MARLNAGLEEGVYARPLDQGPFERGSQLLGESRRDGVFYETPFPHPCLPCPGRNLVREWKTEVQDFSLWILRVTSYLRR